MKKSLILGALAVLFTGGSASAMVLSNGVRPVGYCAIQAHLTVHSGALGISVAVTEGFGRIVCDYRDGSQEILPILVESTVVGIGVQLPEIMTGKLHAPGFGVTDAGALGLLGTYGVVRATGGVGPHNGEVGLAMTVNETGFSIPAILQLDQGFHLLTATLNVGEMTLRFDPRNLQSRYQHLLPVRHPRRHRHHRHGVERRERRHHLVQQGAQGRPAHGPVVPPLPPSRPEGLDSSPEMAKPATTPPVSKSTTTPAPGAAKPAASVEPAAKPSVAAPAAKPTEKTPAASDSSKKPAAPAEALPVSRD